MSKLLAAVLLSFGMLVARDCCLANKLGMHNLSNPQEVVAHFPLTETDIENRLSALIEGFDTGINQLINQIGHDYDKTVRLYDLLFGGTGYSAELFQAIGMVHPDSQIRAAASKAALALRNHVQAQLYAHPEVELILSSIDSRELSEHQQYFLQSTIDRLKNMGLMKLEIKNIQEELNTLTEAFSHNIRESRPTMTLSENELEGMDEAFKNRLSSTLRQKACCVTQVAYNDRGEPITQVVQKPHSVKEYTLGTDYPTFFPLMKHCTVPETRRKMYHLFLQRGFPENTEVLKDISAKRHNLAVLLDRQSFADLQLSEEMVGNAKTAHQFLHRMKKVLEKKQAQEWDMLKADLPDGVELNHLGQIQPWDLAFAMNAYRERHYHIDDKEVQAYFPLNFTINGLFSIYKQFLGIQIKEIAIDGFWHQDVRLVQISEGDTVHGYIVLDLHPRDGKYTHACDCPLLPAFCRGKCNMPALSLLICNFPKDLMSLSDIRTFFHEFGHALHDMFGRTDLVGTCGTNTKVDFVELPSQLLEEWLWDTRILQMCSQHHETKQPLPLSLIQKMQKSRNIFAGMHYMRQLMLSEYSLRIHESPCIDPEQLWNTLHQQYRPFMAASGDDRYFASFGHLSGYGARYYGYLWSKVVALDVFEQIKKGGLLNQNTGRKYTQTIIGRGGSRNPNLILKDFLGREPTEEAFFRSIGFGGK